MTKEFDVVVWGATGFTGALIAKYFADNYGLGGDVRWAIAGRNQDKLAKVAAGLGASKDVPIIVADSSDEASLRALVDRTTTVLAAVGPFAKYGTPIVKLCAETGTHYCDITGEVYWVKQMIDAYNDVAKKSGARIVHCCGFDSIPSDLGAFMVANEMKKRHGVGCDHINAYVTMRMAAPSGGTLASMFNMMEEMGKDPNMRKVLGNPYSLTNGHKPSRRAPRESMFAQKSDDLDVWTAPFVMAAVNSKIVYRSNSLLGGAYGKDCLYTERLATGSGATGWKRATTQATQLVAMMAAGAIGPLRQIAKGKATQPGDGPSEARRKKSSFYLDFVAHGQGGPTVRGRVGADGDPGYDETAKMVAESAICLAKDADKLPSGPGVLTPAVAMGDVLIERLRNAGMTLEINA